jgi:hypothetical protein
MIEGGAGRQTDADRICHLADLQTAASMTYRLAARIWAATSLEAAVVADGQTWVVTSSSEAAVVADARIWTATSSEAVVVEDVRT